MRSHSLFVFGLLLLCAQSLRAAVVLSEIMYDPSGDEGSDEFVELYNNSALPVQLAGWTISDGDGTDTLADAGQGLLAAPNQFILIIDPDYIENGSTSYDGLVPETVLLVTLNNSTFGSRGFSNGAAETISLRNATGAFVAQVTYSIGNMSGHSDEKIRLTGADDSTNWSNSVVLNGTPGFRNSVTPPDRDLGIVSMSVAPEYPAANTDYELSVTVVNHGALSAHSTLIVRADSADGAGAVIDSFDTGAISPAESLFVRTTLSMPGTGIHMLTAILTTFDDDSTNNIALLLVSSDDSQSGILFNEIQSAPLTGRAEWIELFVAGTTPVTTHGLRVSDGSGIADTTKRYELPDLLLSPGTYVVVSADSAVLTENIPFESPIVILDASGFTLNNNGDSLLLYGPTGNIVDRLDYRANWGNDEAGTSLERLTHDNPTNDAQNWNSSVDPSGSTPGRMNSRALNSHHSSAALSVSPSPFTPNGDGEDDVTEIRYQLDQAGHAASVKIFDVRGRLVKRFGITYSSSTGTLLWDGRKDNGTMAATARYIVLLEAENDNGTTSTARTTLILARPQ